MSETTAHLLETLKAELFALEDFCEDFSFGGGIGVGSLAELLSATDHISLIEGGQLGETLSLVLDADMRRSEQFSDHSMAHLHVDASALNSSPISLGN